MYESCVPLRHFVCYWIVDHYCRKWGWICWFLVIYIYSVTAERIISSHSHLIHDYVICWPGGLYWEKTFHLNLHVYIPITYCYHENHIWPHFILGLKQDVLRHWYILIYPYKSLIYTFLKVMIWLGVHWQVLQAFTLLYKETWILFPPKVGEIRHFFKHELFYHNQTNLIQNVLLI